jgi:hypothetical protein
MSEVSEHFYTTLYYRTHPHTYIPTTTSVTINTQHYPRSPDSSHPQYPTAQLRHDAPPFIPRPPKTINRMTKRSLRFRIFNPVRKKANGKSDNARMRIARQHLRKRLRLLQKIKEVHAVAETFDIIASCKFQALCNLIGITAIPHDPRLRHVPVVKAYLHTAPLCYPKIELPLDGSAAWKVLKKLQSTGGRTYQQAKV